MADGMIAGLYRMWVTLRDSEGYPAGQAVGGPANGTLSGAYLINHPVEVQPLQPTYSRATSRGGQKVRATRDLGVSDYGAVQVTLAHKDEGLDALIKSMSNDTTSASGVTMSASNINLANPPEIIVGLTMGFANADGDQEHVTYILNNAQMRGGQIGGSQNDGVNPNPLTYTLTPNISLRTATGLLYSDTALNVEDDSDVDITLRAEKGFFSDRYTDNGSATTIKLTYLPTSDDVNDMYITRNGADASGSVSDINLTTGIATFTAGTAADKWVFTYPTNFVPSPA